ncbi:Esterase B1 [Rhynchospora pubera]|uniref:Esterase B1 n=1 Tax=Rhynchospora pubera TaxID=906938 RepID=A0AAV8FVK1_9POAL|nr:Esterase B1 [Rhynchospora pubera]
MIENSGENVKRYAPPVQRNRSVNRRKGGEKGNQSGSEPEKRQSSLSRNSSGIPDFGDTGITTFPNANFSQFMPVPLEGCSNSEALQFINEPWLSAVQLCNDPSIDPAEKPVMYNGASSSSWGHMKLPHQMDFLGELRAAVAASTNSMPDTNN